MRSVFSSSSSFLFFSFFFLFVFDLICYVVLSDFVKMCYLEHGT